MSLFRRGASAFVVLFALIAVEARAGGSYLFRATESEIDTVMSHYFPEGYDRAAARQQLAAPFDCRNYGDLCREVGDEAAYKMIEAVWEKAKRRTPIGMIARATEQQYDDLSLRWFERLYPDGVPDRDPHWGVFADAGGETPCVDTVSDESNDGKFRVTHSSRRHAAVVFGWGRIKLEHFKKNLNGKFKPEKADRLQVSGLVIAQLSIFEPFGVDISATKDDAKQVAVSHTERKLAGVAIPFTEGCGQATGTGSGIGTVCSCSGEIPFGFPTEP